MLLHEHATCTNSISGAQAFDKTELVDTDFKNVMEMLVEDNCHCLQWEDLLVVGMVCWCVGALFLKRGIMVLVAQLGGMWPRVQEFS